ncbi:helix-turn-helix transcriptional regulator [Cupriavidus gilardii]|uniref:winged helix-turn-helix transcriptional regulator n=1 Tax=Cupriavidus gilardii TaxID=82541 RepID=UPI001ABE6C8D|nr:helix-turn-helix domain-containing protein [Cupriavidus gilardii]MBO4120430.1 helix-turn-helix transcriptional regulator [Cupriavidus gilardii]
MPKRRDNETETCPVARSLDLIGDRWCLLIVRDAFDGVRRFSEFQRRLGVARSILADRLRLLVEAGIFEIQPASDGTSYQEYALTPTGERLFPVIVALRQWGEQHLFGSKDAHSVLVDKRSGKPLTVMEPRSAEGKVVRPSETVVRLPQRED